MSQSCQAVIGYLIPRRSCRNLPDTQCSRCKTQLCFEHARIEKGGTLCPACSLPEALEGQNLNDEVYFSESDLLTFAEAFRRQKGQQGWVEFT